MSSVSFAGLCALCGLWWLIAACSGEGQRDLSVGVEPGAGGGGSGGRPAGASGRTGGAGGTVHDAGDAARGAVGNDNALSVRVTDIRKMTIEIITLACAGDCADIEAVARGGNAPYAFAWEDGSTDPRRRVCLDASQTLSVSATDTAITDDEFSYDTHTATAAVNATVLDCSDAGTPPATGDFCIDNPSLEGTPGVAEIAGFLLPGWSTCMLSPNVEPGGGGSTIAASDGETYLGALDAIQDLLNENASTAFCAPLTPGKPISFSVDIAVTAFNPNPVVMELWGGATSCSKDELLWRSPVVDQTDTWQTFCGTITPSQSWQYLVTWPVQATPDAKATYVVIDNFRAQSSCD